MDETLELLARAIEYMVSGEEQEAAHVLRCIADDIEQSGCPAREDIAEVLESLYDMYSD